MVEQVTFRTVCTGDLGAGLDHTVIQLVRLFTDQPSWDAFWTELQGDGGWSSTESPDVDWLHEVVVFATVGLRGRRHTVSCDGVERDGTDVEVRIRESAPPRDSIQPAVASKPWCAVAVRGPVDPQRVTVRFLLPDV